MSTDQYGAVMQLLIEIYIYRKFTLIVVRCWSFAVGFFNCTGTRFTLLRFVYFQKELL
jgi:hypothetical protein